MSLTVLMKTCYSQTLFTLNGMFDILGLLKVNELGKGAFTTRRIFFEYVKALLF